VTAPASRVDVGPRLDAVLRAAVDDGSVPNVVAVAADRDGVIYDGAAGPLAVGSPDPVDGASIFRIASMTKTVCTVAALQQRERGNLDLDAPVEAYCPGFAAVRVLDGFDGDEPRLRPPATRATVRQLLTHTAGLAYGFWNADLARWDATAGAGDPLAAPMVSDPGTRFEYGLSTDWLGEVVAAVSGQSLADYLAEHVFGPLGMTATTFLVADERRGRCVPVHVRDDAGSWVATGIDWSRRPDRWAGGHGLYSTPRDFLRFQRMLLGGGTLAGATVLDRTSVGEAFTDQLGELRVPALMSTTDPAWSCDVVTDPGTTWGWGLRLDGQGDPALRAPGSGGWMGMFNTRFWVDPHTGVTAAVYSQCLPFCAPEVLRVFTAVERELYAHLSGRP
jgi:CubicO group peptidase (beta-lactamase class C family)